MGDPLQPGDPGNQSPSRPSGAFPFRPAGGSGPTPIPVSRPEPEPGPPPPTGGAPSGGQLSIKDLMAQRAQAAAAPAEPEPPPASAPVSYAAPPPPVAARPIAPPPFPSAAPSPTPLPPPPPLADGAVSGPAAPAAPYSYAPAPAQAFNDDDVLYRQVAPQSVVTPLSIGASGGAAFVGMSVWALIIVVLQWEVGWVAWLLGWGIGMASNYAGGRGRKMGWICAGFAALAIVFGRYVGLILLSLLSPNAMLFSSNTPPVHDPSAQFAVRTMDETGETLQRAVMGETPAQEYQHVRSKADLKEFMFRNGYTVGSSVDEVTDEEIADFKDKIEPGLLGEVAASASDSMPDIDTSVPRAGGAGGMSPWQVYWDHWGPNDLLFWFLGIGGAFYFGGRRDGEG